MQNLRIKIIVLTGIIGIVLVVWVIREAQAQRSQPEIVTTIDGDTMYQVLPSGVIPAITDPIFVVEEKAEKQMLEDEPVMGLVLNGEARAYSLWHLDAHEIVNDIIGNTPVAVTW